MIGLVATLFVLAAESVKATGAPTTCWSVERRWLAGEAAAVVADSRARVRLDRPVSGRAPARASMP